MTLIHVDLHRPWGELRCIPFRRWSAPEAEPSLPGAPFTVPLTNGIGQLDLEPTGEGQAWVIQERLPWRSWQTRWVAVPDSTEVIDYADLVDLDPISLQPVEADDSSEEITELAVRMDLLDAEVESLSADVDQLAAVAATPNGMRSVWRWTTLSTPSGGRMTADEGEVQINSLDADSIDMANALSKIGDGSVIYVQSRSDSSVWARYTVQAVATVSGNVYRFPVIMDGRQGKTPSSNAYVVVGFTVPPVEE